MLTQEVGYVLPKHTHEPPPETPGLCSSKVSGCGRAGGSRQAPKLPAAGSVFSGALAAVSVSCLFTDLSKTQKQRHGLETQTSSKALVPSSITF